MGWYLDRIAFYLYFLKTHEKGNEGIETRAQPHAVEARRKLFRVLWQRTSSFCGAYVGFEALDCVSLVMKEVKCVLNVQSRSLKIMPKKKIRIFVNFF